MKDGNSSETGGLEGRQPGEMDVEGPEVFFSAVQPIRDLSEENRLNVPDQKASVIKSNLKRLVTHLGPWRDWQTSQDKCPGDLES
ncbi:hypothetical protein RRG08_019229 [Elysia crispata]|uniref:Uncharacterized protein n=1 Tax=Elysia crispata TaxID=231223 RepID=A0AAE1AUN5_9GAST|nr:hypothetical protein RRG08_019229 [Elysia crispata]